MNKYKNIKINYLGSKFDSKKESKRYLELLLLEKLGKIKNIQRQVKFELQPSFRLDNICIRSIYYVADFVYFDIEKNKKVVEDVKAFDKKRNVFLSTSDAKIKIKIFKYKYCISGEYIFYLI